METRRVAVIMAGGSGERFWPLSRREYSVELTNVLDETVTFVIADADGDEMQSFATPIDAGDTRTVSFTAGV